MISKAEERNKLMYSIFLIVMLLIFNYANYAGWRVFNTDEVEHTEAGKNHNNRTRFYHK